MKYRSKKGTVIDIPDGLTPKQIAAIKADADAGYGTRAQKTADSLGAKLNATPEAPPVPQGSAPTNVSSGGQANVPASEPVPVTPSPTAVAAAQGATPQGGAPTNTSSGGARNAPAAPGGDFNATWYLRNNPDVLKEAQRLKAQGDPRSLEAIASDHWRNNGKTEGRPGVPTNAPAASPTPVAAADPAAGTPGTTTPVDPATDPGPPLSTVVDPTTGTIDPDAAAAAMAAKRQTDADIQFKKDNPDQTDQYGNTVTFTQDPVTGKTVRTVTQGATAKAFTDAATAALGSFDPSADRKGATDAAYGTITKYYDRDMARDLETQKQELAERGIPYDPAAAQDPNSKNLYGRTIGGINQRYTGMKDDASKQAILAGNQAYATTSTARDSFLQTVTAGADTFGADYGAYQNSVKSQLGDDAKWLIGLTAQQVATVLGISVQQAQLKIDQAKLDETIRANKANETLQGDVLTETKRANIADEELQMYGLTAQEAQDAIDNEIKIKGLDQAAADSLRNDATAREAIFQTAKANKAQNKTANRAISASNSGGGGGDGKTSTPAASTPGFDI